jgi:outer membrane protein
MKRPPLCILRIAVTVLAVGIISPREPSAADSFLRIIGDKPTKAPISSGNTSAADDQSSPDRGINSVRIIGDKPYPAQTSGSGPEAQQGQNPPPSRAVEIRLIGDKKEITQKKAPEQPAILKITEQELAAKTKAAEERRAAEKSEQERLAVLKAEEIRKAIAKAEQERIEAMKAEEEHLTARKAEETRKAIARAEQERIEAIKAEEERLAAARKALAERLKPEAEIPAAAKNREPEQITATNPESIVDNKSEQPPATIWELYLAAKANDPALGRMEARVAGSKADSDVLVSSLMPHVDSRAGIQQISQHLSNYTANDTNNDFTAFNYNVSARMTLLNVPTLYSLSAAAASQRIDQAGVAAARQNLIVKFTDSYFALLKAQTDKQIALGEINRLKQVLDQSQAFLKAGTGDIIAVYEAQSRLDGAKADLNKSESTLRLAEQKLASLVGKPIPAIVNYLPQQPTGPDPDNIDWWVATMEKEQPIIRQAREGLTQTAEQRKATNAEYLPTLQASGGYDVNRGTAALPNAEVRQWFVGATLSLPLYSGGETSAKIRRAVASEEERRRIFDETMDQQRENVKQAFFNLRYNISFIRALEQKTASAEIQLAAISKGRKIGTRNAIDLLNADQAYSVALRDYKYALYDNVLRVIQLKSAAGILAEADISELPTAAPTLSSGLRMFPAAFTR